MPRLEQLHTLLLKTPSDPFLTYGIALEHKKTGDATAAVEWLEKTIALDARYCYAYFQKGQVLESLGQTEPARQAYREGIMAARAAGDGHAESELRSALEMME